MRASIRYAGCFADPARMIRSRMHPTAVRASYLPARLMARSRHRVEVDMDPADLEKLRQLRDERMILLANHPMPNDWLILYLLSSRLGSPFHYMTAHEQLTGLRAAWMPWLGAYSVRRGGWGDRGSYLETLRLLRRPGASIVIFPEGRCSFATASLLPFHAGAARIGFTCLERESRRVARGLTLVPTAIRYRYAGPADEVIDYRLARLARRFGDEISIADYDGGLAWLTRRVVAEIEKVHGLASEGPEHGWRDRLHRLCGRILDQSERRLGIVSPPRAGILNRACYLRQVLSLKGTRHGITSSAAYARAYYPTLLALVLESIGEIDLDSPMPTESRADLLYSIERIVYRIPDPAPVAPRLASVRFGEGIDLRRWLPASREDRRAAAHSVTAAVRSSVENLLAPSSRAGDVPVSMNRRSRGFEA